MTASRNRSVITPFIPIWSLLSRSSRKHRIWRYELENGLFATVYEKDTRQLDTVALESHKKYIDLQYCISGGERMAWAHIQELNPAESDPEHDNYFYTGKSTALSIRPGMFYIMFPSDGHKAGCHNEFPKHYRKVVVKIPIPAQDEE